MESRKMVPMNLSAEQQWRCRHREQTYGHGWGRGKVTVGQTETAALTCPHYRVFNS